MAYMATPTPRPSFRTRPLPFIVMGVRSAFYHLQATVTVDARPFRVDPGVISPNLAARFDKVRQCRLATDISNQLFTALDRWHIFIAKRKPYKVAQPIVARTTIGGLLPVSWTRR